jgi:hypothetical protein
MENLKWALSLQEQSPQVRPGGAARRAPRAPPAPAADDPRRRAPLPRPQVQQLLDCLGDPSFDLDVYICSVGGWPGVPLPPAASSRAWRGDVGSPGRRHLARLAAARRPGPAPLPHPHLRAAAPAPNPLELLSLTSPPHRRCWQHGA